LASTSLFIDSPTQPLLLARYIVLVAIGHKQVSTVIHGMVLGLAKGLTALWIETVARSSADSYMLLDEAHPWVIGGKTLSSTACKGRLGDARRQGF
ncbi:hypothetical protein DLM20_25560, partial [Salmonella enterica subsp. enterica serovar Java]|nr:hypothetical protein [Salmonella enterica subsp. enterica serovar Java]